MPIVTLDAPVVLDRAPGSSCRVLIADDHAVVREGVAMLVGAEQDMAIVGQAGDGRQALDMARVLQPDVVVLDVSMPDMRGPAIAQELHRLCPRARILALTRHADQSHLRRMLQAGANGYLVKRAASDELIGAIRAVARGDTFVDPNLANAFIARSVGRPEASAPGQRGAPHLSEREEQVLRLIAWGKSNKEVAAQLGISMKTAEGYKATALEKLGLRTRTDIVRYALAERWLDMDDAPE